MSRTEPGDLVERGRRVLALEADAIARVAQRLGPAFAAAVRLLAAATGRVIVSGVGKSGLIARKIAATFTSSGTPASFLERDGHHIYRDGRSHGHAAAPRPRPPAPRRPSCTRSIRCTATWGSWAETTWRFCCRAVARRTSCSGS